MPDIVQKRGAFNGSNFCGGKAELGRNARRIVGNLLAVHV